MSVLVNSASAPTFEEEEDIPAVAWVGMGLFLENKVAIRGYFDAPSTAGLYVQISDDEGNVLGRVTEEDFTTATGPAGTPVTGFLFDGLSVNQMSKVVNITVYNEIDQVVSGTYTYSIESYAYKNQNSSNTVLAELVKSMIKKDSQFVTVIYGEDVTVTSAKSLERELNNKFGDKVEITFIDGGQPVYYYIISVE